MRHRSGHIYGASYVSLYGYWGTERLAQEIEIQLKFCLISNWNHLRSKIIKAYFRHMRWMRGDTMPILGIYEVFPCIVEGKEVSGKADRKIAKYSAKRICRKLGSEQ